jgi:chemotaxis protein MotB
MLEAISLGEQIGRAAARDRRKPAPALRSSCRQALGRVADEIEKALAPLVAAEMIAVRRESTWVEVEIRTDILFASGVAELSAGCIAATQHSRRRRSPGIRIRCASKATPTIAPSARPTFPSNWELSAARAASVVHLFAKGGVDPARLAVIGLGEFRPAQSNDTGRGDATPNRRVLIVILGDDQAPEGAFDKDPGANAEPAQPGESAQPEATPTQPYRDSLGRSR